MIGANTLALAWPKCPAPLVAELAVALSMAAVRYGITTVTRAAVWLGQLGWECDEGTRLVEDEDRARAYEGRKDLGNVLPGDGVLFRGRGFIHLTGRDNYRAYSSVVGVDLEAEPELAAGVHVAALVAAAYWESRGCNALADALELRAVTQAINGRATDGPPSYHDRRVERIHRAAMALGVAAPLPHGVNA